MLSITQLSVKSNNKSLLNTINLELAPGAVHLLMGHNGSGKSTLLNALMGHPAYQIVAGDIKVSGESIVDLPPEKRAQAGFFMSFQSPPALPGVSVHMIMQEALRGCGKAMYSLLYERTEAAISLLGIDRAWLHRPLDGGFSGGERKLLELVQLMIMQPCFVFLDEIDAGLDADVQKRVSKALCAFAQQNPVCAWLIATHQPLLFVKMQPQAVHILCNGQMVCTGNDELITQVARDGYRAWQAE